MGGFKTRWASCYTNSFALASLKYLFLSALFFTPLPLLLYSSAEQHLSKGPGKRGHIVADTSLPRQMFPRLPARAAFVADTNFVFGTQKMFLILFSNILCPQQMFPSLRSLRNNMGNNVSATMCPRLPRPRGRQRNVQRIRTHVHSHCSAH